MTGNHDSRRLDALIAWLDDDDLLVEGGSNGANADVAADETGESNKIATELVVHGLMRELAQRNVRHDEVRVEKALAAVDADKSITIGTTRSRSRLAIVGGLASLAAGLLIAVFIFGPSTVNATDALERLIATVSQSIDRAYRLNVLEEYSQNRRPQNLLDEKWNVRFEDELNGAMLYVGGENHYVFVRQLKDGRTRVSGCDGNESWAFREDSPIHVSQDLTRYRGGLPGHQQNFGFTDIDAQLKGLRDGYEIQLERIVHEQGIRMHRLTGERKSKDVKGPKTVEIDFDFDNGTIHRMMLDGLPRGRGGPKSIEFELVSQRDVEDEFYAHGSHHGSNRRIKVEGPRK